MGKWSDKAGPAPRKGDGGMFARLKADGESIRFVVHGEPASRFVEFVDGKPVDRERGGPGIKSIVLLPIVDADQKQARLLEIGLNTFRDLAALIDDPEIGGEAQVYRITRSGTGMDTRYRCDRIREAPPELLSIAKRDAPIDPLQYGGREMGPSAPSKPVQATPAQVAAQSEIDGDIPFSQPAAK